MPVKPIPDGYPAVIPYLIVDDPSRLLDFLSRAFGARETERVARPDGTIAHAQVRIGESVVMMGGACGDWAAMPGSIYLYVADTDVTYRRALDAGATSVMEPADQFYGDRNAGVRDPCGNVWWIATHQEDVAPAELQRRAHEAMRG